MRLGKYHGLGNDFLVALGAHNPGLRVDPDVARALCDRHRGIGADGLIYGLDPADRRNDAMMVLLNADGSRAEISGNGIRCLAQALLVQTPGGPGVHTSAQLLRIETDGGLREVRLAAGNPQRCAMFTVDMGTPRDGPFVSESALAWGSGSVATVDIGNPHLVLQVEDPTGVDLEVEGPALESPYADGINVSFVAVPDPRHLVLRVWERGAGVTEACGSGAAAAVVAANGWGLVDAVGMTVEVTMPGGSATVEMREGSVYLTGPSEFVAEVITP
jgi:diaminopimelate epimerase